MHRLPALLLFAALMAHAPAHASGHPRATPATPATPAVPAPHAEGRPADPPKATPAGPAEPATPAARPEDRSDQGRHRGAEKGKKKGHDRR